MRLTLAFIASMGISVAALAADPFSTLNPAHHAGERAAYLDLNVFLGSDVAPVRSLIDGDEWVNKYDPRKGENIALATARVESGVVYNGWRIGHVIRQEWKAVANRASLDVYRARETKSNLPAGHQRLSYDLDGWSAQGIQFGGSTRKQLGASNWTLDLGLSISLLEGKRIRRENWSGDINHLNESVSLINAKVTKQMDSADKDILRDPITPIRSSNSRGHTIDIGGSIGHEGGLRLDWAITDLVGRIKWKGVSSESLRTLPSNPYVYCTKVDKDCTDELPKYAFPEGINPRPTNLTQKLKPKHAVTLSIPVNQAHVEIGDSYRDGQHFPRIGVRQHLGNGWGTRIDYDFRLKSVGLALAHKWLYLNYQTDHLNPEKAKVQGLALGARIPF